MMRVIGLLIDARVQHHFILGNKRVGCRVIILIKMPSNCKYEVDTYNV